MKKLLLQLLLGRLSSAGVVGTVLKENDDIRAALEHTILDTAGEIGVIKTTNLIRGIHSVSGLQIILSGLQEKLAAEKLQINEPGSAPQKTVDKGEKTARIFAEGFSTHLGAAAILQKAIKDAEGIELLLAELSAPGVTIVEMPLDGNVKTEPSTEAGTKDVFVFMPRALLISLQAFLKKNINVDIS